MSSGLSVVDFMNLPPVERRIMRLVMRSVSITYPQLRDAVTTMPAEQRLDERKLNATLEHLTQDHWLIQQKDGAYHASIMHRTGTHSPSLWSKLEAADVCPPHAAKTTSGGKRTLPTNVWDCLLDDSTPSSKSKEH